MRDLVKLLRILSAVKKVGDELGAKPTPKIADKAIKQLTKLKAQASGLNSLPQSQTVVDNLDLYIAAIEQIKAGNGKAAEKLLTDAAENWTEFLKEV